MIAGGSHPSFGLAAKMLGQLAEVTISGRQVGRITEEIGQEMAEKRDLKTTSSRTRPWPRRSLAFHGWLWSKWMGDGSSLEVAVLVLGRMRHPGRKTRSPA